jgi:hypothetical protein
MKILFSTLKIWLPVAAALTIVFIIIYLAVQQSQRSAANDPQIQLAEDAAHLLAANQPMDSLLPGQKVDIAQSLAIYWIIFDANGAPQTSNASLHGSIPTLPSGVFDSVRQKGEDRISYQPEPGVRSAVVVAPVAGGNGGFVLVGRSLYEVEIRESRTSLFALAGWGASLVLTFILIVIFEVLPVFLVGSEFRFGCLKNQVLMRDRK